MTSLAIAYDIYLRPLTSPCIPTPLCPSSLMQLVGREQYLLASHVRAKKITDKVTPPPLASIPIYQPSHSCPDTLTLLVYIIN